MKSRVTESICLFVAVSLFAGCSTSPHADYDAVELIAASGTVTLDGSPVADAVVAFEGEGGTSFGLTDDSGHYTLQFESVKKGVTPGKKTIRVSTTRKVLGLNSDEEDAGESGGETDTGEAIKSESEGELVPVKYNARSALTVEVTPEEHTYDFELSSK